MSNLSHAELLTKWQPVLDAENVAPIRDYTRRVHTALLMENTVEAVKQERETLSSPNMISETNTVGTAGFTSGSTATGPVAGYDPILISLLRRNAPVLMAYDVCGVQPMTGPSGLVFAMRSTYNGQSGPEALYNEANTYFSGNTTGANALGGTANMNINIANIVAANVGNANNTAWFETNTMNEMGFSIEKVQVLAQTRGLKAGYTLELAQDLKAVHGLEAEAELSNIISTELLAEINREVIRKIYISAVKGVSGTGVFNLNTSNAAANNVNVSMNWADKYKMLVLQIEKELNQIERDTRLGKGNILIVSGDVGSALSMSGRLQWGTKLDGDTGQVEMPDTYNRGTFLGLLNGRTKVYADPYSVAGADYAVAGLKGDGYKVGLIYAPYVPLQMVRAVDPANFQPSIGFKTRYGLVANPYAQGDLSSQGSGAITANSNLFYRKIQILGVV